MPFWKLHYHLVWATHDRQGLIDETIEEILRKSFASTARSVNAVLHAFGAVEDHVHLVASIPPSIAISEAVGRFKGASSHAINNHASADGRFRWQGDYGALSVSDRGLAFVVEYALNQKTRHAERNLISTLERIEPET